jgi:hypothetical protein
VGGIAETRWRIPNGPGDAAQRLPNEPCASGSARQPKPSALVLNEPDCFKIGAIESRLPLRC